jgi:hypothetical protein
VLPQQVEDTPVRHGLFQQAEEDVVVDDGVIVLHVGAEDERVGGELLAYEPDGGLRPAPTFQVVAVRREAGGQWAERTSAVALSTRASRADLTSMVS